MALLLTSRTDGRGRLVILGGVLIYAACGVSLSKLGYLESTQDGLLVLLGLWCAGFVATLAGWAVWSKRAPQPPSLTFGLTVWGNTGVIAISLLTPGPLRLLLMTAAGFSIIYAATRLARRYVVQLGVVTGLMYVAALLTIGHPLQGFELVALAGFMMITLTSVWIGVEIGELREAFDQRTKELNEAVRRDDLTGLFNRREFMSQAGHQKALAERGKVSFALCFLDLDHFKGVNDRFGHPCGDDALVRFARIAENAVRDVDFVARVGGEEFVVLLSDVTDDGARLVAERIRSQTSALQISETDPSFRMTVSTGIAQFRLGDTIEGLMDRADRALYHAKTLGRDRIEFAHETSVKAGLDLDAPIDRAIPEPLDAPESVANVSHRKSRTRGW